jgi:phage terminase small subunit
MSKNKKLTNKEMVFCEEYIRCWNGAASARAAGFSAKTAREQAYDLLTKPHIRVYIKGRLEQIRMETGEVYARLSAQARADISELVEFYDVPVLDKEGNDLGTRQSVRIKNGALEKFGNLIKSISPTSNGDFKVELYSAQTALELMGKTYSLFVDRDEKGRPIIPATVNVYIPKNDRADSES